MSNAFGGSGRTRQVAEGSGFRVYPKAPTTIWGFLGGRFGPWGLRFGIPL